MSEVNNEDYNSDNSNNFDEEDLDEIYEENNSEISDAVNNSDETIFTLDKFYKGMVEVEERKSIPFLTKYEQARIIGIRGQQISQGAPILVDPEGLESPVEIALKELRERKLPFIIQRVLPNNKCEYWRIDELKIPK